MENKILIYFREGFDLDISIDINLFRLNKQRK